MQSYQVPNTKQPQAHRARLSPGWAWFIFGLLSIVLNQLFLFYVAIGITNLIQSSMDSFAIFLVIWIIPILVEFPGILEALIFTLVLWVGLRFVARFRFGNWIQWLLILLSVEAVVIGIRFVLRSLPFSVAGFSSILVSLCVGAWISYWQQLLLRPVASIHQRRLWILITIITYGVIALLQKIFGSYLLNLGIFNFSSPNFLNRLEQGMWLYTLAECLIRMLYLVPTAILLQKMVDALPVQVSETIPIA